MIDSPLNHYQQDIASGNLIADEAQYQAVLKLQRVYEQYVTLCEQSVWHKFKSLLTPKEKIQGLYLWGSVGIGKTYLMDTFYHTLPGDRKYRVHFHHFMRDIHRHLKELQGYSDPLVTIAKDIAAKTDILCFDEFFVNDITDAMVLRNLFTALFEQGLILVTTSNVQPDELYRHGLQRQLFLPAIAILKQNVEVFHVDAKQDYRLRALTKAGVYLYPNDKQASQQLQAMFERITLGAEIVNTPILIEGREIATVAHSHIVVWFDFDVLCHEPRSQRDYLEIAQHFNTVLLSGVPAIEEFEHNKITYLINLVDVFYDANVKLIIAAAVPVEELYVAGRMLFEFERTKSRLIEMQSEEYLARPHG